jgi:hypothetical protein
VEGGVDIRGLDGGASAKGEAEEFTLAASEARIVDSST